MYGDIVLFIRKKWEQFWCIHDYKTDPVSLRLPMGALMFCEKCDRMK